MSTLAPAMNWDSGKFEVQRKLGNFVQYFQVNLPTNNMGVPLQLIDPVPLMEHLLECETTDDMPDETLSLATLNVEFDDGYPTIDGLPIWERLDGERMEYYKLFKEYREMPELHGTRALTKLGDTHNIESRYLNTLSKVYHWQLRCRAYDAHQRIIRERKRQHAIEQLESKHSAAAAVLLERGMQYIEDHPEQLNPKVALQMVESAIKVGRLALGLSADKPGSGSAPAANININQTTAVAGDGGTAEIKQTSGSGDKKETDYLQSILHILDSSGALDQAKQEIIDADFSEVNEDDPEAVEGT